MRIKISIIGLCMRMYELRIQIFVTDRFNKCKCVFKNESELDQKKTEKKPMN